MQAVLCDFGLSRLLESPTGLTSSSAVDKMSVRWSSPEILSGSGKSKKGDIWAWGCLLLEVSENNACRCWASRLMGFPTDHPGKTPLSSSNSITQIVVRAVTEKRPPEDMENVKDPVDMRPLLRACWIFEPVKRADGFKCASELYYLVRMAATTVLPRPTGHTTSQMARSLAHQIASTDRRPPPSASRLSFRRSPANDVSRQVPAFAEKVAKMSSSTSIEVLVRHLESLADSLCGQDDVNAGRKAWSLVIEFSAI